MSWNKVFVGGDPHGNFKLIKEFTQKAETTKEDLLILVGDVGLNYNLDKNDADRKRSLSKLPISFLLVRGNHEARPENVPIMEYGYVPAFSANLYYEKEFPSIYYINAGTFTINQKKCLAVGGAYSVDKIYRMNRNPLSWFYDEQINAREKFDIKNIIDMSNKFDYVFTHTCPYDLIPRHLFLSQIDQSTVDCSMEQFLQNEVYKKIEFDTWYCGHYHNDEWLSNSVRLLYKDFVEVI